MVAYQVEMPLPFSSRGKLIVLSSFIEWCTLSPLSVLPGVCMSLILLLYLVASVSLFTLCLNDSL